MGGITPVQKNEAVAILQKYDGSNPYILKLKRDLFVLNKKDVMSDFNMEYVLSNYIRQPRIINKVVKIGDWYAKKRIEDKMWNSAFIPQKIQIIAYLGETSSCYHCYIKYKQNMEEPISEFIPKKAIIEDFLLEDYHNVQVDFDRYDQLSKTRTPDHPRTLLSHQKEGIQFLLSRKKCILGDDMGMGKSCTLTVASIEGNFDAILIICPASLKKNWVKELTNYVSPRDVTVIGGYDGFKKEDYERLLGYGIKRSGKTLDELKAEAKERGKWSENRYVIINYEILKDVYELPASRKKVDIEHAKANRPILDFIKGKKSLVIIDEVHNFSKMDSKQYKITKQLLYEGQPDSIYLVTGTLMTNNPQNYFAVLSLLDTPITTDWEFFMKRYCGARKVCKTPEDSQRMRAISAKFIKDHNKASWYELTDREKTELESDIDRVIRRRTIADGSGNLEELRDRTAHLYIRRMSDSLENELPPKFYHDVYYDLTPEQFAEYNRLWDEYVQKKVAEGKNADEVNDNQDLLDTNMYRGYLAEQMVAHTEEMVNKCIANNEKVVVACNFDKELYSLQEYYGDKCVIYNGKMNLVQKDNAIEKFINDPNVMVFIGNIEAAGVGITLIVARVLIFNSYSWIPALNQQMAQRIYRIGQTRKVHIYNQYFNNTQSIEMKQKIEHKEEVINTVIKKENEK